MLRGIYYNQKPAICSIYESGKMCFDALSLSNKYTLDYSDEPTLKDENYDFVICNYHHVTNNWIAQSIHKCKQPTFAIVTEIGHSENAIPFTPFIFDYYIVLDPTIIDNEYFFGFSRPLENFVAKPKQNSDLIIGSFGMPTFGKNWKGIVEKVQDEFDQATIRFNIPYASYVRSSEQLAHKIFYECSAIIHKPNIKLHITHDYMSKQELVDWCSQNTINVFLYNRDQPGLCATTDQAIIADRPLLVSQNDTFRHILQYLHPYPQTIKEAIDTTLPAVRQMQKDWNAIQFAKKFENIVLGVCHEVQ
jgi:hypothetical protein